MSNDNYISFQSYGNQEFKCNFKISDSQEIKVFIGSKLAQLDLEYTVTISASGVTVICLEKIGTIQSPVTVTLVRTPTILRYSQFSNSTQIKSDILDLEFNNIFDLMGSFQSEINRSIKIIHDEYNHQIILPFPNHKKSLVWSVDNSLENSSYEVDSSFGELFDFVENISSTIQENIYDHMLPSFIEGHALLWGSETQLVNSAHHITDTLNMLIQFKNNVENGLINIDNITSIDNNLNTVLPDVAVGKSLIWGNEGLINSKYALDTILDELSEFKEEITHGIVSIPIPNKEIGKALIWNNEGFENSCYKVDDTFDQLFAFKELITNANYVYQEDLQASNIIYQEGVSNVQEALDELNESVASLNNISVAEEIFCGAPHSIISGISDNNGAAHIKYSASHQIKIDATEQNPLVLSFTFNNKAQLVRLVNQITLNIISSDVDKVLYVYLDVSSNGVISAAYKTHRPYYLYYNPITFPNYSSVIAKDKYSSPSDFFHIPTMTMFDTHNNAIKRIYIGQIKFLANGNIASINSYTHGANYVFDRFVQVNAGRIDIANVLGTDMISFTAYYKSPIEGMGVEFKDNYVITTSYEYTSATNFKLITGLEYLITDQQISIQQPQNRLQLISMVNMSLPNGHVRFHIKRLF